MLNGFDSIFVKNRSDLITCKVTATTASTSTLSLESKGIRHGLADIVSRVYCGRESSEQLETNLVLGSLENRTRMWQFFWLSISYDSSSLGSLLDVMW